MLTVSEPCESVIPEFGDTLSQLPPPIAVVATKVVPGIVLASVIVCPAGRLVAVALKVSDVGVTLSVGATRVMLAVWELLPSEAVTVAL
jgi:hypothetical protein